MESEEQGHGRTTQYGRTRAELDELNAYREDFGKINRVILRLQAERDARDGRAYRYSPEERAEYDQHIQELEEARQKNWEELRETYDIAPGVRGQEPVPVMKHTAEGYYGQVHGGLMYEWKDQNPDAPHTISLTKAMREREADLKMLAEQQKLTPLKETREAMFPSPPPSHDQSLPSPAAAPPTLTPAEIAAHIREAKTPDYQYTQSMPRREWSQSHITPLKETLDAIRPEPTHHGSEGGDAEGRQPAPPQQDQERAGFWQQAVDQTKGFFSPQVPAPPQQAPPVQQERSQDIRIEQQLEQRAGGRPTLPGFLDWRQSQEHHISYEDRYKLATQTRDEPRDQPTLTPSQLTTDALKQAEQGIERLTTPNMESGKQEATEHKKEFDIRARMAGQEASQPTVQTREGDAASALEQQPTHHARPEEGRGSRYEEMYRRATERTQTREQQRLPEQPPAPPTKDPEEPSL